MIARVIDFALRQRIAVLILAICVAIWGIYSVLHTPIDAIPDLSDTQVIIKTSYAGQSPQVVEDQVTYPISTALLAVPRATAVRGFSMFGESFVYVIFEDGVDPYWARSRILESLAQIEERLPEGAEPILGPNASSVGWVFEYALVDRTHQYSLDELRALQDFFLRYELQSVPGVAEVAAIGGAVKQFQVEVHPHRLAANNLTLEQVAEAIRNANAAGGGSVMEMGHTEYAVRFQAYLNRIEDFRNIPLGQSKEGLPLRLADVASVQTGPALRRGVAELNGEGEVTGGVVIMRYQENALRTLAAVKEKLTQLRAALPPGVELVVTYDRSGVITRAVATLRDKLLEETLAVTLACLVFLFHLRSSLVAVVTLPLGVLAAFIVLHAQGLSANIMSLGGIAIAIGTMVDGAIVMIENMHKHLERAGADVDYWQVARTASVEVGPAIFFSLLIIAVSFLPVFALTGQEAKLFGPLAATKTYAMAAAAGLSITLIPVLMAYVIRGRIRAENRHPVTLFFQNLYRPVLRYALTHRRQVMALGVACIFSMAWPLHRLGSEFMPPLDEGDILYMPTTLPGISLDEATHILQLTDRLIREMPEVEQVFGKAGRADTATDPAPLTMLETTIILKPRAQWPNGGTLEELIHRLDAHVRLPGLTNSWGYPIRTRIDMLSTGIRSTLGLKISGADFAGIENLARAIETILKPLPATRAVYAERAAGGHYIDIELDRVQAARYGVSAADLRNVLETAIGGREIATAIDGRQRFGINLRYQRNFRDSLEALAETRIATASGARVALGTLARIAVVDAAVEIKSENGRLVSYVFVDVGDRDIGGYVAAAQHALDRQLHATPGYTYTWSGQYQHYARAKQRLALIAPVTLAIVVALLMMYFRNVFKTSLILLCLPLALVGAVWYVYALGYHLSVAVAIGLIALAGIAIELGVVMLLYIDNAWNDRLANGAVATQASLYEAIEYGALARIRPKMMTISVILAGLIPLMLSDDTGADVMKRIAAPLVGGMLTAPLLSLVLVPVLFAEWQEWRMRRARSSHPKK
ncbi:MAG: CusA/CzcA family heavy metal efflux RND transporter [Pseudomonadota bacterium]